MDVSIESLGSILRKLTIGVPASQLEIAIEKRVLNLMGTIKLPGFRPGKVPKQVVESRFSAQILREAAEELIDVAYRNALNEKSLVPAGFPSIETKNLVRGEDLQFVATFEIFPELENPNIRDCEIDKPICSIDSADINRTVDTLLKQHTEWIPTEDQSQLGDRMLIDYVGTIDGERFDRGEAKDHALILGEGGLLPEFEEELENRSSGTEKTISARFPADYGVTTLAGKVAEFSVKIKEVAKPSLPQLNEDFIKKFGLQEATEEAFRAQIGKNLEQEAESRISTILKESVFSALLNSYEFEVPNALVEDEINRGIEAFQGHLQQHGLPPDESPKREDYRVEAQRRVRLALLLREAVSSRGIEADSSVVRSRLEQFAQNYSDPKQVIDWHYADAKRLNRFESIVLEELLVDALLAEAKVVEKNVAFQNLMTPDISDADNKNDQSGEGK